jgi:hypothetical protein
MASHKYQVGQNIRFRPNSMSSLLGPQYGTITRQLPVEAGNYLYRIKCVAEKGERVATEGDLSLQNIADTTPAS